MKKVITALVLAVMFSVLFTFAASASVGKGSASAKPEYDLSEYMPYDTEGATKIIIRLSDFGEKIPSSEFWSNKNITDVYIEDGITEIGSGCFDSCTSLKHVRLPATLKKIGDGRGGAFALTALEEIYIPGGVEDIESETFLACPLKKIVIGEGVEHLWSNAFKRCAPEEIILPESIKTIDTEKMYTDNLVMYLTDNIEKISNINGKKIYVTEGSKTHQALLECYKLVKGSDTLGDNIVLLPKSPQTGDNDITASVIVLLAAIGGMYLARKIKR